MKRITLITLFALAACAAEDATAQNICEGYSTSGPTGVPIIVPATDPRIELECLPEDVAKLLPDSVIPAAVLAAATGRGYGWDFRLKGASMWMYCPRADGTWRLRFTSRTYAELKTQLPAFAKLVTEYSTMADLNLKARNLGWGDLQSAEHKSIWCPAYAKMLASLPTGYPTGFVPPATPVPTIRYVTAGTGAVYLSDGTKLLRVLLGRKTAVGVTAICTTKIVSGASTYCTFTGALSPLEVTLVKVAP
jgi:hypothetical protein